jgi:hypothetical protein
VHAAFGTVLWIVCIAAALIALVALATSRKVWQEFGRNTLLRDSELPGHHPPGSAAALRERDEEIRQMLEARNARRVRRGQAPLDVEAEIGRLTGPATDPQLESEIRQLVKARNYRRARAGKPPLDVEAEVRRELAKLNQSALG